MVIDKMGSAAMLEQTAEECAELTQACLKMARDMRNENPVSKTAKEKLNDNLIEELADVQICIIELRDGLLEQSQFNEYINMFAMKYEKFKKRFENKEDK